MTTDWADLVLSFDMSSTWPQSDNRTILDWIQYGQQICAAYSPNSGVKWSLRPQPFWHDESPLCRARLRYRLSLMLVSVARAIGGETACRESMAMISAFAFFHELWPTPGRTTRKPMSTRASLLEPDTRPSVLGSFSSITVSRKSADG